jgi:transcription antitermination factor NusG
VIVWAIATLIANRELAGVGAMVRAGLREFYLPRVVSPRQSALFPGYVFIRPVDAWRPILLAAHVTGVLGIGRSGGTPLLVKDRIIDEIRSRERNGFVKLPPPFPMKARVRVHKHTNAFFGSEGICDGMRGQDRVYVLLRFLGRVNRVDFHKADLILA